MNKVVKRLVVDASPFTLVEESPPADTSGTILADLRVQCSPPLLVDWCVVQPLAVSSPSVAAAERRKAKQYCATKNVIAAVCTAAGSLSAPTLRTMRHLEKFCDLQKNALATPLVCSIVRATALMVRSARLRAGISDRKLLQSTCDTEVTASLADLAGLDDEDRNLDFETGPLLSLALSSPSASSPVTTQTNLKVTGTGVGEGVGVGDGTLPPSVPFSFTSPPAFFSSLHSNNEQEQGECDNDQRVGESNNGNLNASVDNQVKGVTNLSGNFVSSPPSSFVPAHLHPSVSLPPE
jgi:hypothetical protein